MFTFYLHLIFDFNYIGLPQKEYSIVQTNEHCECEIKFVAVVFDDIFPLTLALALFHHYRNRICELNGLTYTIKNSLNAGFQENC